jgi:hypothetical protein
MMVATAAVVPPLVKVPPITQPMRVFVTGFVREALPLLRRGPNGRHRRGISWW